MGVDTGADQGTSVIGVVTLSHVTNTFVARHGPLRHSAPCSKELRCICRSLQGRLQSIGTYQTDTGTVDFSSSSV